MPKCFITPVSLLTTLLLSISMASHATSFTHGHELIALYDANADQQLSYHESAFAPRLEGQFLTLDTNHDGFLTAQELDAPEKLTPQQIKVLLNMTTLTKT